MTTVWTIVVVTGAATLALKSAGPVLLGGRPLPARVTDVVSLLAPALLAALVAIGTFAQGRSLTLDARVLGVGAAAVAIRLRAPLLVSVVLAAVVTGLARTVVG